MTGKRCRVEEGRRSGVVERWRGRQGGRGARGEGRGASRRSRGRMEKTTRKGTCGTAAQRCTRSGIGRIGRRRFGPGCDAAQGASPNAPARPKHRARRARTRPSTWPGAPWLAVTDRGRARPRPRSLAVVGRLSLSLSTGRLGSMGGRAQEPTGARVRRAVLGRLGRACNAGGAREREPSNQVGWRWHGAPMRRRVG